MNTTPSIIYGRAAYEGFAKVIGSRLGLSVKIDDGATACIDAGGVIHLPGMNTYQTAREFAVTCGVIVHELSHQFYGSHHQIDPKRSRLAHDCLNAVLDVADETWIDRWFCNSGNTRPGELLEQSNRDAVSKGHQQLLDWSNPATHAWKVLCIGILSARLRRMRNWCDYTASQAAQHGVDAKAVWKLLRRAKIGQRQNPQPWKRRFATLIRLAEQIADLLKPLTPPPGSAPSPMLVAIGSALAQGKTRKPKGAQLATAQQGADAAEPTNAAFAPGGYGSSESCSRDFDPATFALLGPAVSKVAQRIATDGDGITRSGGFSSGSMLGEAHRLLTDGQCLARWDISDHADGLSVAIALDCSGSMDHHLPQCAGIARAFALAMRQAGAVKCLVFGDSVDDSDNFARVRNMGGTATDQAMARAADWLATRHGRKWIVIITDGMPANLAATNQACWRAAASGIEILAVGLGCRISMPATRSVVARDAAHLAIELDAAAQLIERGAA